jgi:hypothetical protein
LAGAGAPLSISVGSSDSRVHSTTLPRATRLRRSRRKDAPSTCSQDDCAAGVPRGPVHHACHWRPSEGVFACRRVSGRVARIR